MFGKQQMWVQVQYVVVKRTIGMKVFTGEVTVDVSTVSKDTT